MTAWSDNADDGRQPGLASGNPLPPYLPDAQPDYRPQLQPNPYLPSAGQPPVIYNPMAAPPVLPRPLFQFGDIVVTPDLIITSSGTAPVAGSTWFAFDQTSTTRVTPTWAAIAAIVGFFFVFLFSLLFLLAKEQRTAGHVAVQVRSGNLNHIAYVPVRSLYELRQVQAQVAQAQAYAQAQR